MFTHNTKYSEERIIPHKTPKVIYLDHLARYKFIECYVTNKVVLDVGCGNGYGTYRLAEKAEKVIGVDISKEVVGYAKEHYLATNLYYRIMDATKLEFRDETFDVICSFDVIEHISDFRKYLSEIKRVLKKGGWCFISTPNKAITSPYSEKPINPFHSQEFYYRDFKNILEEFFNSVKVLGECESTNVKKSKNIVLKIYDLARKVDPWNIRKIIPQVLKLKLIRKICSVVKGINIENLSEENIIFIKNNIENAPIFLAIVQNI